MSERATLRLTIRGRVQGVGFRYAMAQQAQRLGIAGWVRNRRDGGVEAVVQGSAGAVEAMRLWAERGPEGAAVTAVDAAPDDGRFDGFEVRPTA
jgi:acylphosphatase